MDANHREGHVVVFFFSLRADFMLKPLSAQHNKRPLKDITVDDNALIQRGGFRQETVF